MLHQVAKVDTPWAQAQNHDQIVLNGYQIVFSAGITNPNQLVKVLVHMIWACGWRQACYNYNTHKIKIGSWWDGPFFTWGTIEEVDGVDVIKPNDTWRSYGSYSEGIHDYLRLLARPHMKRAQNLFYDDLSTLQEYGAALEKSGYWTSTKADEGEIFASMGRRVTSTLERHGILLKNFTSAPPAPQSMVPTQSIPDIAEEDGLGDIIGAVGVGAVAYWLLTKKKR